MKHGDEMFQLDEARVAWSLSSTPKSPTQSIPSLNNTALCPHRWNDIEVESVKERLKVHSIVEVDMGLVLTSGSSINNVYVSLCLCWLSSCTYITNVKSFEIIVCIIYNCQALLYAHHHGPLNSTDTEYCMHVFIIYYCQALCTHHLGPLNSRYRVLM